eukprot:TRINITY_DN342_c0_g1_i1.p1 TRINITY_DN342_c0_g1~~TRINITY_DN342_c0_g1_i1.p1  ORF type:complete len:230 (+),score=64.05 TRINITY_DN342_c0_g1_i1:72-761(+)
MSNKQIDYCVACSKPAQLICPTCKRLNLPEVYFCSQECFTAAWKTHKAVHDQLPPSRYQFERAFDRGSPSYTRTYWNQHKEGFAAYMQQVQDSKDDRLVQDAINICIELCDAPNMESCPKSGKKIIKKCLTEIRSKYLANGPAILVEFQDKIINIDFPDNSTSEADKAAWFAASAETVPLQEWLAQLLEVPSLQTPPLSLAFASEFLVPVLEVLSRQLLRQYFDPRERR